MKVSLIVSVIGPDQPGLVEKLSRVVTEAGGNWEGSRLMKLGGQFAGMVQVVVTEDKLSELQAELDRLAETGLSVSVIHSGDSSGTSSETGKQATLEVVGQDRSGIVAAISEALAREGVNVLELATDCRDAPMSGERLFHTTAVVLIPETVEIDLLRERIESIAGDLMVEFGTV